MIDGYKSFVYASENYKGHPFEIIESPTGHNVHIDKGLVPIITSFWAEGINTLWSCQGGQLNGYEHGCASFNKAYICFDLNTLKSDIVAILRDEFHCKQVRFDRPEPHETPKVTARFIYPGMEFECP